MSLELYKDGNKSAESSGQALVVLPNGLQITEEEHEKRLKDVSARRASRLLVLQKY